MSGIWINPRLKAGAETVLEPGETVGQRFVENCVAQVGAGIARDLNRQAHAPEPLDDQARGQRGADLARTGDDDAIIVRQLAAGIADASGDVAGPSLDDEAAGAARHAEVQRDGGLQIIEQSRQRLRPGLPLGRQCRGADLESRQPAAGSNHQRLGQLARSVLRLAGKRSEPRDEGDGAAGHDDTITDS